MAPASLDIARRFAGLGFSTLPVPPPDATHDGKVPAIAWREFQTRRPMDAELVSWFSGAPMNIAIITGAISCVVVVDVDSADDMRWAVRRLPYTPWQTRTPRGYHLFYRHPSVRVPNRARVETQDGKLAIDVRGDGGFVIAPGSVHASGATYLEAGDWTQPRERVPVFWPGWLERPHRSPSPASRRSVPASAESVVGRARAYLAAIPRPEIGAGSDAATLYAACRVVRGFGLTATDAEDLLWEWAGGRSGWTREWVARKVAHAERYGTEPIGALR